MKYRFNDKPSFGEILGWIIMFAVFFALLFFGFSLPL